MIRKALLLSIPTGLGLVVAHQWPELRRYFRMKQMSQGNGHPENVPMRGTQAYPKNPADGARDGTGDFDSASRGGPSARP